ncbi:hypothetical protein K0M31_012895 [Melipona bicolor]|uniref:Uncharacterized protein n=1 Tax=Melipona bicolor TaxID=60889 RepID=A0AA40KGX9_9HYME|nr:hypothetical protein K0M31_012895 [Melipona bicolor]
MRAEAGFGSNKVCPFTFSQVDSESVKDGQGNIVSASLANKAGTKSLSFFRQIRGTCHRATARLISQDKSPSETLEIRGTSPGDSIPFFLFAVCLDSRLSYPGFRDSHFIADANLQIENDRARRGLPRVPLPQKEKEATDRRIRRPSFNRSVAFVLFFFLGSKQSFAYNRPEGLDLLETHV